MQAQVRWAINEGMRELLKFLLYMVTGRHR
jgi:hypothetical protein